MKRSLAFVIPVVVLTGCVLAAFLFLRGPNADAAGFSYDPRRAVHAAFDGNRAFAHVRAMVELGPRPAGSEALEKTRRYCEGILAELGWEVRRQAFDSDTPAGRIRFVNLRARWPAAEAGPFARPVDVVLGSHYETKLYHDFVFVGANDSASSSAALLEIARVAAAAPEFAERLELVFFDGEEAFGESITPHDGLYGSRFYALQLRQAAAGMRPKAAVVLDMIGDRDLNIGLPVDTDPFLARLLLQAAAELGFGEFFAVGDREIIDDHTPLNLVGIPAMDIIDLDYQPYWHTAQDTLDRLSPDSLTIVGQTTLLFLEKYLLPSLD
ncbi:MAG TPA: M28 family peptidase [Verrucomicrobiales bacterium]|nr:M28 family peptidase [Verrucomicrobiales bacterium]